MACRAAAVDRAVDVVLLLGEPEVEREADDIRGRVRGREVERQVLADVGGAARERAVLGGPVRVVGEVALIHPALRYLREVVVPSELHHVGRGGLVADEARRDVGANLVVLVESHLLLLGRELRRCARGDERAEYEADERSLHRFPSRSDP